MREPPFVVTAKDADLKFNAWLVRGDKIGVFANEAMDSAAFGELVFVPITPDDEKLCVVGKTHLADGIYGAGWRYVLQAVTTSLDDFKFEPVADDGAPARRRRRGAS